MSQEKQDPSAATPGIDKEDKVMRKLKLVCALIFICSATFALQAQPPHFCMGNITADKPEDMTCEVEWCETLSPVDCFDTCAPCGQIPFVGDCQEVEPDRCSASCICRDPVVQ